MNFVKEYKLAFDFLKKSKEFIYLVIGLFLFFGLVGFFVPVPEVIRVQIIEMIKNLLAQTEGLNAFELVKFIFLNNFSSSFFSIFFGVFFGILPFFSIIFNGYILGFVCSLSVREAGIFSLWKLFPHGIFEIPAIFISFALGIKFGTFLFWRKKKDSFSKLFWEIVRVFILIVIPLLIVAAVIEGNLVFLFS